jgi:hypothetical protein
MLAREPEPRRSQTPELLRTPLPRAAVGRCSDRKEGPARVCEYRVGRGPSNMCGRRPSRVGTGATTVAASHRLFQSYPFRSAPASSPRHPSGHSQRSTPVLCRADFGEPPQREVSPRTRRNRRSTAHRGSVLPKGTQNEEIQKNPAPPGSAGYRSVSIMLA